MFFLCPIVQNSLFNDLVRSLKSQDSFCILMQKTINRTGTELEIKKHNREKKSNNEKKIVKKKPA